MIGGYDGTPQSDPGYAAGMVDEAFNFDGANDFIRMGNVAALNPGMASFTVEAWFLRTRVPDSGAFRIASKGLSRASSPEYEGWALHGDSTNWFAFTVTDGTYNNYYGGPADVRMGMPSDGQWHHVAGVLDRTVSPAIVRLYVDGVLRDSDTTNWPGTFGAPRPLGAVQTDLSFSIGAQDTLGEGSGRQPTHFFPGLIDEVLVYRRALTGAEIAGKQASPSTGGRPGFGLLTGTPAVAIDRPQASFTPAVVPIPSPTEIDRQPVCRHESLALIPPFPVAACA